MNPHAIAIPYIFHFPQIFLCSLQLIFLAPVTWENWLAFCSYSFAFSKVACKYNHKVHNCFFFLSSF